MCKARQVDVGWSLISCLALHSHRLQKLVFFSFYELWVLKVLTRKTKQNFPIQNLFCCCPMSLYRILSRLKQKFSTFSDHMIKFLLPEFGQAGWDNIWFSVKAHGPCCTLYIICTVNKYTSTSQSRDAGPKVSTVLHSTLQDQQTQIIRIMCTICVLPCGLGQHIGRQSTDISVGNRPTIGRQSTDSRPTVDLIYRPIVNQYINRLSADASADMCTFIGRLSTDSRPIVGRQSTDISADVSADMSTKATYSTHDPIIQRNKANHQVKRG